MGTGTSLGVMKMFCNYVEVVAHNLANVLNATGLHTSKRLIYVL